MNRFHWIVAALATVTSASCSKSDSNSPTTPTGCVVGTKGCPCTADLACAAPLACAEGFCVPVDCTAGELDCRCDSAGRCGLENGTLLSCVGNVCVATTAPVAGEPGASCAANSDCSAWHDRAAVCEGGVCTVLGCAAGAVGCPCAPYGYCRDVEGNPARCLAGSCSVGACVAGTPGCVCNADGGCSDGASCREGLCRTRVRRLTVAESTVQTCRVIIDTGGAAVASVEFAQNAQGSFAERPPRLALALGARAGAPLNADVATLEFGSVPQSVQITQEIGRAHV